MKHILPRIVLAAILSGSGFPASAEDSGLGAARPREAKASFGGRLQLPGGITLAPMAFDRDWKAHGGVGTSTEFVMECGAGTAENATDGGIQLAGKSSFSATPAGAVSARWSVVPDQDGLLAELCVSTKIPKSDLSAVVADGLRIDIREGVPPKPRLFEAPVSTLSLVGPDGAPSLEIAFASPVRILVQDNQQWGNASAQLRLFFAIGAVEGGKEYAIEATISTPGTALGLADPVEVVVESGPDWIPYPAPPAGKDWILPGSALDLGATMGRHEPAGAFGRVVVVGDHFELEDRPGEEIRFCGANIVHNANIPDPESADRFAANLARMGYNSVRIHHHDPFLASPGTPPGGKGAAQPQKEDPGALDVPPEAWERFDALVDACIRHGLYITTDLYVSRYKAISPSALGLGGDRLAPNDFKRLVAFHEPALDNLLDWTRVFLGHVNPHTGRSLAQEPALAALAIVNEGNVGNYGINRLKATPGIDDAWRAWLEAHPEHGLTPDTPIPGEIYDASGKRQDVAVFALFLSDRERRLFDRVAAVVRGELGCRAPLSNLSAWYYPEQYLRPLSDLDYIDNHFYVAHPAFVGKKWRFPSAISTGNPFRGGYEVPDAAWRRVFGKPFCVTEWNWAAPLPERAASGLAVGALAARQGWSGIWRFAWSHNHQGVEAPGSLPMKYFDLHSDPAQRASEYAALALYLRGDMEALPPETERARTWDLDDIGAPGHASARRLGEALPGADAWKCRVGMRLRCGASDRDGTAAPAEARETPPTPPASADAEHSHPADDEAAPAPEGAFQVVTRRTCGGYAESGALTCGALRFDLAVPGETRNAPAAVWASSLDGKPLAESRRILVAHVTDAANTGAVFDGPEAQVWIRQGATPALVRNGRALIQLEREASRPDSSLRVFRLSPTGERLDEVRGSLVPADGARATFSFAADVAYNPDCATLFYEVVEE